MSSISDLPPEMTDHIFSFLPFADQKSARLVCRQWHQQLSSSRFWKATKLRLALGIDKNWSVDDLLRVAGQGKFTCIEVSCGQLRKDKKESISVTKLLEASRFSLEELQFTCYPLNVFAKDLLLRCLNGIHLPALHSLTLTTLSSTPIQPEELGGGFSRMLEQLQTLKCTDPSLFCSMLPKMLKHCQNLKFLAIENCCISNECAEQMFALKGLKDLRLKLVKVMDSSGRDPPLLELSYLENVLLPSIGIRLGQLPRLTSVAIEGGILVSTTPILSQLQNMYGIGGKRCRKLTLTFVSLEWECIDLLRSLSIDVLFFEDCYFDYTLFEVLAQPQTRKSILKIMMHFCTLFCNGQIPCRVQTVEQLRGKFPWIQIERLRHFHRCNIPNQIW